MGNGVVLLSLTDRARLSIDGVAITLRSHRATALAVFLALSGQLDVRREAVAALLWDDIPEDKARASMRQIVLQLRRGFEKSTPWLEIDRQTIGVRHEYLVVDIEQQLSALERGDPANADRLVRALRNGLLAGFEDVSEAFGVWLEGYRAQTEARFARAITVLVEDPRLDADERRRLAETALALDPLDERACRALMELCARAGDLAAALKTYQRLYEAMDADLGMEPSAPTQDLVVRIKQGQVDAASLVAAPPRTSDVRRPEATARDVPVVAVLPFRIAGPKPIEPFIPLMLADDIVCRLAGLDAPLVISSNSSRRLDSETITFDEVARRLGAGYALCGTLAGFGSDLRLVVQLVETRSSITIWADRFWLPGHELFTAQDAITAKIASKLTPSLDVFELRVAGQVPTEELSAYQLVLRARELIYTLDRATFFEAGGLVRRAIDLDPRFALAHITYADWLSLKIGQGWSEAFSADRAAIEKCAGRAAQLNASQGRALAMLGHNLAIYARRYEEATTLFRRAIDAAPGDAETLLWSVPTLAYVGENDAAVTNASKAMVLSPEDPLMFRYEHFASIAHFARGDHEMAAALGLRSMNRNPHYTSNLRMTAASLVELDRVDEASEVARQVLALEPDFRVGNFVARQAFACDVKRRAYGNNLLACGLPP